MPNWLMIVMFIAIIPFLRALTMYKDSEAFFALIVGAIVVSVVIIFYAIETKERNFYILKGQENGIFFYLDIPNERAVCDFIDLIFANKVRYLIGKYGKIDKDRTREDNLARIIWLKDQMVIDEETYNELKYQLDHPIYGANPILGFKRSE
jgi:hypothetical protein